MLVLGRIRPVNGVHLTFFAPFVPAAAYYAQLRAFVCIRAAALARWLRAVRIIMRSALKPDEPGIADITDIILAQLASWHAGLPHDEVVPKLESLLMF